MTPPLRRIRIPRKTNGYGVWVYVHDSPPSMGERGEVEGAGLMGQKQQLCTERRTTRNQKENLSGLRDQPETVGMASLRKRICGFTFLTRADGR